MKHSDNCAFIAASVAAGSLFCGDDFGRIQRRDLTTGQVTAISAQRAVGKFAVSSDGTVLTAVGGAAPAVSQWRLDGARPATRIVSPTTSSSAIEAETDQVLVAKHPGGHHQAGRLQAVPGLEHEHQHACRTDHPRRQLRLGTPGHRAGSGGHRSHSVPQRSERRTVHGPGPFVLMRKAHLRTTQGPASTSPIPMAGSTHSIREQEQWRARRCMSMG